MKKRIILQKGQNYTKIGRNFINAFESKFMISFPEIYKSIEPILDNFENPENFYYLLYGLVQSGKSIAISFIMWILIYKHRLVPIFITKNLDSIRLDIMEKIKNGFVSDFVSELCKDDKFKDFTGNDRQFFIPVVNEIKDLNSYYSIKSENYSTRDGGSIAVFLMNKHNYELLVEFSNRANKKHASLAFIMDEYHMMFPDQLSFIENNGCRVEKNKVSALDVNHWIHNLIQNKDFIIGVTATPFRAMADIVLYPPKICRLHGSPPKKDYKYYSFAENDQIDDRDFAEIEIKEYKEENIVDILEKILENREYYKKEIPCVLVCTERVNDKQNEIKNQIEENFSSDYVQVKVFNQKEGGTLSDLFDKFENNIDKFKDTGIFVIVSCCRVDTGITVKPSREKKKQCRYIWGITDQIVPKFKHLECNIQKLRLIGWYPKDHRSTLWVPKGEENLYRNDMWQVANQMVEKYDGHPSSISELIVPNGIKHVTGKVNDLYGVKNRFGMRLVNEKPEQSTILKTKCRKILNAGKFSNIKLTDLYGKTAEQNKLRQTLELANHIQVPYSKHRLFELLECGFGSKMGEIVSDGRKINGIVVPKNMNIDCKIKDCFIVSFDTNWKHRQCISTFNGKRMAFKLAQNYWYLYEKNTHTLALKHFNVFDTFKLCDKHYESLDLISNMYKDIKKSKRKESAWDLFRKVHKQRGLNCNITKLSEIWKNNPVLKAQLTSILEKPDNIKLGVQMCKELGINN